jgi:general secretion pathway protein B
MSYILEALKKAQAERQLGNAPTIHAAQTVPAPTPDAAASRKPLLLGLGAGALVVAAGAAFLWRGAPASTAAPAAVPAAATQAAAVQAPAARAAGPAASDTLAVSAPPAPAHPEPRPAQPRLAEARPAPAPAAVAPAAPVPAPKTAPAPVSASAAARTTATPPASVDAAPEDSLPFLQQLPANIQSQVPRVAFGGYMYSANPADRLLLIDKALRHEGEEVAPGLVLEKLLPRAAVMNYRGYRYRVAY